MTLIHWWKLDETSGPLADSGTPGGYPGTASGTISVPGLFTNAQEFTTGDYIDCGSPADMSFGSSNFSIGQWFYTSESSIPTIRTFVSRYDTSGSDRGFIFCLYTGGLLEFAASSDGTALTEMRATTPITMPGLHHAVVTRSGTTYKFYVDGVLIHTATGPATIYASTKKVILGAFDDAVNRYSFIGWLDNTQVWDQELSATEISDLYYEALPSFNTLSLANRVPLPEAGSVARDTNIQLSIVDSANNIDLTTVDIWVKGTLAYDGATDTFQTGFDGPASVRTGTSAQYDFTIDPTTSFAYDDTVTVRVYAQNDVLHELDETYQFYIVQDVTAPEIENRNPAPSETGVALDAYVYAEVFESQTEVQRNTITVYIAGTKAIDAGVLQAGFTGTLTPADATASRYYIDVKPSVGFGENQEISVRVVASNTSVPVDTLDTTYAFHTWIHTTAPVLQNQTPAPDAVLQDRGVDVEFEIYDDYGFVADSVKIYVDRDGGGWLEIWNTTDGFATGYTGSVILEPGSGGTIISAVIDPDVDWTEGSVVKVRVVAEDSSSSHNAMDSNYEFGVAYHPALSDLTPGDGSTGVSRAANIGLTIGAGSAAVVQSSIEVTVDGDLAYDGDGTPAGFQPGYQGPASAIGASGDGWVMVVDPESPLDRFKVIVVTVKATDALGHEL